MLPTSARNRGLCYQLLRGSGVFATNFCARPAMSSGRIGVCGLLRGVCYLFRMAPVHQNTIGGSPPPLPLRGRPQGEGRGRRSHRPRPESPMVEATPAPIEAVEADTQPVQSCWAVGRIGWKRGFSRTIAPPVPWAFGACWRRWSRQRPPTPREGVERPRGSATHWNALAGLLRLLRARRRLEPVSGVAIGSTVGRLGGMSSPGAWAWGSVSIEKGSAVWTTAR